MAEKLWKQGVTARLDIHDQRLLNLEAGQLQLWHKVNQDSAQNLWEEVSTGQLTDEDKKKALLLVGGVSAIVLAGAYRASERA